MPQSRHYDPLVLASKTVFLQRVQEAVGDGYRFYVMGGVSLEAAARLVRKFKTLYSVNADKDERYRRKAQGMGNARLYMRTDGADRIEFILLVSPGLHPAHQTERLSDADVTHLRYHELELVLLTGKRRSKPSLTWRMTSETFAGWRERLHMQTAQYNRDALFMSWYSLYRTPGFAGIRQQVGALVAYWRSEWVKLRGSAPCPIAYPHNEMTLRPRQGILKGGDGRFWTVRGFPSPAQCPKLFYVRKQADVGVRLSHLLRNRPI